jgi:hypothetical protein
VQVTHPCPLVLAPLAPQVASFTGVKRRLDVANGGNAASESRDSRGSVGGGEASSGEVGSRGSKGARKTVSAAAKSELEACVSVRASGGSEM